jgi:hypothetical protein
MRESEEWLRNRDMGEYVVFNYKAASDMFTADPTSFSDTRTRSVEQHLPRHQAAYIL